MCEDCDTADAVRSQLLAIAELAFPERLQAVRAHIALRHQWELVHESLYCATHNVLLMPSPDDTPPAEREYATAMMPVTLPILALPDDVHVRVVRVELPRG